jgi:hypothetical protein
MRKLFAVTMASAVTLVGFAGAANASATVDLIWIDTTDTACTNANRRDCPQLGTTLSSVATTDNIVLLVRLTAGAGGVVGAGVSVDYSDLLPGFSTSGFRTFTTGSQLTNTLGAVSDIPPFVDNINAISFPYASVGHGLPAGASAYLGTVTFHQDVLANGTFEIEVGASGPGQTDGVGNLANEEITSTTTFNSAFVNNQGPTPTPTATPTATPTVTPTATPTATPTPTPTPTATPTAIPTFTPTAIPTFTPTATPTATSTATPTASPTATPTATPTPAPESTSDIVDTGGGTVSTGTTATSSDPVETSVTVPPGTAGGVVVISEGAITETPPRGFNFLGQQVDITAPDGTTANPLVLTFSVFAPGMDPNDLEIFKATVLVGPCVAAGADPDPCVESRTAQGADNVVIAVRTSMASPWNFGMLPEPGLLLQLASGLLGLALLDRHRRNANR